MIIEEKLKKDYGLKRNKKYEVGKTIGNEVWFHKKYINEIIPDNKKYIEKLPSDFNFDVIRYNEKDQTISFIQSKDFDTSHEPIVGDSITIQKNKNDYIIKHKTKSPNNSLIYHHKWLFVKDDYNGFNLSESKERSLAWKEIAGKSKELSSKIGRLDFWTNWLYENKLPNRDNSSSKIEKYLKNKVNETIWKTYLNNDFSQKETSKKTARLQKPRTLKMLQNINIDTKDKKLMDIGCGIGNEVFEKELKLINIEYYGIDPFNKTQKENMEVIEKMSNGNSDFVTINNVLNTIPEKSVWKDILKQAENCINQDGILLTLIYEGEKNSSERALEKETQKKLDLKPIKTRDGWQNRLKTEEYLTAVKEIFPHSEIIKTPAGKVIISTKNPKLNLNNLFNKKIKNKLNHD